MANMTKELSADDIDFIKNQKMFFVTTAPKNGKLNLSPKGLDDTFKIIDKNTILWLNYFGSGNETAAHLLEDERMTIMFCAFQGDANILRLYCKAKAIQEKDDNWDEYINHFAVKRAARQVFEVTIETINNSCGMAVPFYEFLDQRKELDDFFDNGTKEDHIAYMKKKNQLSFDGKETKLFTD